MEKEKENQKLDSLQQKKNSMDLDALDGMICHSEEDCKEKVEMHTDIHAVELSCQERVIVEEHERLSPHLIFEIIRRDGIEELYRPNLALLYSGIAAGVVITFSFLCMGVLNMLLPSEPWAPVFAKGGYTIGFILVILGRMQLFTENTITTVAPICRPFAWHKLMRMFRLWGIVLVSNLIGTSLAASFLQLPQVVSPELATNLMAISNHVLHFTVAENLLRGIPAGVLIAAIVWMMPSARNFSFFIIAFFTYFIAVSDFTHVVVGSAEVFYAVLQGKATMWQYFFQFLIPTGIGNIIGGTVVFTLLIFGQIKCELPAKE